jgi:hypothetical protein
VFGGTGGRYVLRSEQGINFTISNQNKNKILINIAVNVFFFFLQNSIFLDIAFMNCNI